MPIKKEFLKLTLLTFVIALCAHNEIRSQEKPSNQDPVALWSECPSVEPKRQAKSKRYDRLPTGRIIEAPFDVDELPVNVYWWKGLPGLPVAESDAIVVGYVRDAHAYLSNNRSVVYSEFSLRVDEILKEAAKRLSEGQTIVAQRLGGAVIFPSGKVQHYRVSKQGFPQTDEKYILFLKSNGQDYDIITGYAIGSGQVIPLDQGANLPFASYQGKSVDYFLTEIKQAISASTQKGSELKWHTAPTCSSQF